MRKLATIKRWYDPAKRGGGGRVGWSCLRKGESMRATSRKGGGIGGQERKNWENDWGALQGKNKRES